MDTTYIHLDINPLGEESHTLVGDIPHVQLHISGTTLVYTSIAAGSRHNQYGGANVICIVKDLKYNPGTTTVNTNNGILYGSEYQLYEGQALNSGLRHNHNVPCAVCHVSTRSSQIMVPGTYQCPSGWTSKYSGWLMAGHHGHKGRNMFTCIDKDAEFIQGQQANNPVDTFHPVTLGWVQSLYCDLRVRGNNILRAHRAYKRAGSNPSTS